MKIRPDLIITYPPDYDGELYIQVDKPTEDSFQFTFIYFANKGDSAKKILAKVSTEISNHASRWNWHEK